MFWNAGIFAAALVAGATAVAVCVDFLKRDSLAAEITQAIRNSRHPYTSHVPSKVQELVANARTNVEWKASPNGVSEEMEAKLTPSYTSIVQALELLVRRNEMTWQESDEDEDEYYLIQKEAVTA